MSRRNASDQAARVNRHVGAPLSTVPDVPSARERAGPWAGPGGNPRQGRKCESRGPTEHPQMRGAEGYGVDARAAPNGGSGARCADSS